MVFVCLESNLAVLRITPGSELRYTSGIAQRIDMAWQQPNPIWLNARQMPYPLYCLCGPSLLLLLVLLILDNVFYLILSDTFDDVNSNGRVSPICEKTSLLPHDSLIELSYSPAVPLLFIYLKTLSLYICTVLEDINLNWIKLNHQCASHRYYHSKRKMIQF